MMMMRMRIYADDYGDDDACAFRHSTWGKLEKMQNFHDSGAEQRQDCAELVEVAVFTDLI